MNWSRVLISTFQFAFVLWACFGLPRFVSGQQNPAYQNPTNQNSAYAQQGGNSRPGAAQISQPVSRQLTPQEQAAMQAAQAGAGQPGGTVGDDQKIRVPLVTADQAAQQGLAQVPQQPFPQLTAEEQKYLDQVLDVWEKRTEAVQRYECDFRRWQYDPTKYAEDYFSRASGKIKYMEPDKGMFVVDNLETIAQKQPQAEYKVDPRRPHGEYWICDGEWIYIRDRNEKKETRYQLPPQMRGQGIHLSPLPFLFGVKAMELKQRYWIRPIQAPPGDDGVWLEAWPKRADDAGNYQRVQVVLDRSDILPRALIVFLPNWRPGHEYKEIYEFLNRTIPNNNLWNAVKEKVFRQAFIPTALPSDWQIIEEPYIPPEQQPQQQATAPSGQTPPVR